MLKTEGGMDLRIQQVEALVGVTKKNIRFYEEQGLLKPMRNAENGYREYAEADVETLRRIKLLRKLAVPIDEIRWLLEGRLTLEDCLKRHIVFVEREEANLRHVRNMCKRMQERGESLAQMDVKAYTAEMENLEKEGVHFMDVTQMDKKQRKRAPIIAATVMILLMGALMALFIWASVQDPSMPLGILIIFIAIPVIVIVGVLLALRERMQEIEKGEEDEASKY